jgi:pyridoxine 5-phosphate synthase
MMGQQTLRLGVNIDHVATIRNARGGSHPDPLRAAKIAVEAGADGITAHLREDRRHIRDIDIARLKNEIELPLNLEMAATEEMLEIALRHKPNACCIVPERRAEVTTEGGLDAATHFANLAPIVGRLKDRGIRVSLFLNADMKQLEAAHALQADIVEIHTGAYCEAHAADHKAELADELARISHAAREGAKLGLEMHAGHGLSFETVAPIAALPEIVELNIGHFLIGEAVFVGLSDSIREMLVRMRKARA